MPDDGLDPRPGGGRRRPGDQPRGGPRRRARPLRAHGGRAPGAPTSPTSVPGAGRRARRRGALGPDASLHGPLPVPSPRRPRTRARPATRRDTSRGAVLGHGRVDPPVAREPRRRAGGGGRATPRPHRRGRSPGDAAASPEAAASSSTGPPPMAGPTRGRRSSPTWGSTRWSAPTAWPRPPPCTPWWSRRCATARATTRATHAAAVGRPHGAVQRRGRRQPRVVVPHAPRARRRS